MNYQTQQLVETMTAVMIMAMGFGMVRPVMLQQNKTKNEVTLVIPGVTKPLFPAQRKAMEKTLATIERLHQEAETGEIITVSRQQVVNYGWHPGTGRVYMAGGDFYSDRIVGLWGQFEGDKINKLGRLRGSDADPWIYFSRRNKKYRTPLYTDPSLGGSEKLISRLKEHLTTLPK